MSNTTRASAQNTPTVLSGHALRVAACEIDNCGVPPIGRCATCGRTFCASHQAFYAGTRYSKLCAPCLANELEEAEKRREEARAPQKYFWSGTALETLRKSGVKPVKLYHVTESYKPGRFGFGSKVTQLAQLIGQGWLLGTFPWEMSVSMYGEVTTRKEDWLTALGEADSSSYYGTHNGGLFRVRPYSDGYEAINWGKSDAFAGDWKQAGEAVRYLSGKESEE